MNEWKNIDIVRLVCKLVDEAVAGSVELKKDYPFSGPRSDLITFVKDRPGHDMRYAIDASKITTELGWKPEETFETGILKTVKWYIDNRSWWENIISGAYTDYYSLQYGDRV